MLSIKNIGFIIVTSMALLASTSVLAGGKSYGMVCKGGGRMSMSMTVNGGDSYYLLYFQKAKQAGTVREPGAGECTWMDRPIRSNEPIRMVFKGKNPILRYMMSKGNIRVNTYARGGGFIPSRTLIDAVTKGKKFFIQARTKSRLEFQITKVGL